MPTQFAYKVMRATIHGTCYSGAEIWSTSFYVGSVGADAAAPTQAFADAIRTAWTTLYTSTAMKISSQYQTSEVKLALLDTAGKTDLATVTYAPYGTPANGWYSGGSYPPQVALAVTLEHTGARGLAAKGRMYFPGPGYQLTNTGTLSGTDIAGGATAVKTFLDAVNAAAPSGNKVILASQGRRVKGSDGKYEPVPGTAVNALVDRVKIGSVLDTQRRRRNGLVEVYQTATLA